MAAVEDYFGRSFGVGWAYADPDTLDVVCGGQVVGDTVSLRHLLEDLQAGEVLAGVTMFADAVFEGFAAQPVGSTGDPARRSAEVRRGVAEGRVFHDGSPDLAEQMGAVRVVGTRRRPGCRRRPPVGCAAGGGVVCGPHRSRPAGRRRRCSDGGR